MVDGRNKGYDVYIPPTLATEWDPGSSDTSRCETRPPKQLAGAALLNLRLAAPHSRFDPLHTDAITLVQLEPDKSSARVDRANQIVHVTSTFHIVSIWDVPVIAMNAMLDEPCGPYFPLKPTALAPY